MVDLDVPLFSVLLSLTVLHFSVSMSLFYKRRNTFPIRGHAMGLVLLNLVAVLADGVQTMIGGILGESFYCVLPVLIKIPAIYVYALAYLARVWRIWFKYQYSNEKVRAEYHRVIQTEDTIEKATTLSPRSRSSAKMSLQGDGGASAAHSSSSNDVGTKTADVAIAMAVVDSSPSAAVPSRESLSTSKPLVEAKSTKDATSSAVVANDKIAQWFYEKRRYFGRKSLRRIVMIGAAVLWVLPLTLHFVGGSTFSDQEVSQSCDEQNAWPGLATFAIVGGFIIAIGYTTYRARNIYDGYFIKREICVVLVCGIVGVAVTAVQPFITLFVYRILWFALVNCFLGACLTWKVYISYSNERELSLRARKRGRTISRVSRKSGSVSKSMSMNLKSCMNNEISMSLFMEHLKREFSVENILFYQAVQRFRTACTGDDITGPYLHGRARNHLAAEIYARFVDENGELQVNLSAQLQRPVLNTLCECIPDYSPIDYQHTYYSEALATPESGSPAGVPKHTPQMSEGPSVVPVDIFDDCQMGIFRLMEKDSFVRFKVMLSHDVAAAAAAPAEKSEQPSRSSKICKSNTNSNVVTQV